MFGEHGIYCSGKLVALFCDDQLFMKPTEAGKAFIGSDAFTEGAPYPGAKPWFLISGEHFDDNDLLSELTRVTANELPVPKPKAPKPRASTTKKPAAKRPVTAKRARKR